jgi:hypothetical protein
MPDANGKFGLTVEEHDRIVANGHETSLHYNFMDGFPHPCGFTQQDVQRQWDWFCETFRRQPIATVNHWCRWYGWAEPAKWMRAAGGRADNSRLGLSSPPLNPVNHIGFAFGTAFPHYYYDDWRSGNARIDFLAEPIMAYEVGYEGDTTHFEMTHRAVDIASYYHMTANFFHHPIYIAQRESCRAAIDELLRYVRERGLRTVFMGCDALWQWWDARQRSGIEIARLTDEESRFVARCEYPDGMVVKVPVIRDVANLRLGENSVTPFTEEHFGLRYAMLVCPKGETEVTVAFA